MELLLCAVRSPKECGAATLCCEKPEGTVGLLERSNSRRATFRSALLLDAKSSPLQPNLPTQRTPSQQERVNNGETVTVVPRIPQSSSISPLIASMLCPFGLEVASTMPEQPPLALHPPRHERCPTACSREQPWGNTQKERKRKRKNTKISNHKCPSTYWRFFPWFLQATSISSS